MESIKVVFVGVQNAGKTTLINILSKKYSLISNLTPTKSIQQETTEIFGVNIISWDIPGQVQLRETALKGPMLDDASILVFVVDVQDTEQIDPAMEYFDKILRKIELEPEASQERPYIIVFIHKMDPDIQRNVKILKNVRKIQTAVKKIAIGFEVDFFVTSMFREPTIYLGFSSVFRKVLSLKKTESIKNVLASYSDQLNAILIVDKNNFIINHFERDENDLNILQDFIFILISAYKNALAQNLAPDELKVPLKELYLLLLPMTLNTNETFVIGSTTDPQISLLPLKENIRTSLEEILQ
jgi:small GTP-binding protein